jgi:hypothetical protein
LATPIAPSPWLTTAFFTGAVSLAVFALNIIYKRVQGIVEGRKKKRQVVESLYAEVMYNVSDLETFLRESPNIDALRSAMSSDINLIPHITDARHVGVYNSNIAFLHMMDNEIIPEIITFYAYLDKLKMQIDGTQFHSYRTISIEGRVKAIEQIIYKTRNACEIGRRILQHIENSSPAQWNLPRHVLGDEQRKAF